MAIRKGNKHQLGLFFLLEACQRNAAGWSTAVWPANAKLPLPHRRSSITRPCCSIERSSAKLLVFTMHFEVRALERLRVRTRGRVGSAHRRGNHMHDHSRFQRDIDYVTGVSLSLSPSHKSHWRTILRKRFRASYNTSGMPFILVAKKIGFPSFTCTCLAKAPGSNANGRVSHGLGWPANAIFFPTRCQG